jgi:hypothetical protein
VAGTVWAAKAWDSATEGNGFPTNACRRARSIASTSAWRSGESEPLTLHTTLFTFSAALRLGLAVP